MVSTLYNHSFKYHGNESDYSLQLSDICFECLNIGIELQEVSRGTLSLLIRSMSRDYTDLSTELIGFFMLSPLMLLLSLMIQPFAM